MNTFENIMVNGVFAPKEQMLHFPYYFQIQKSKCSIFHNIFKYMIFQRRQKALLWSKGLRSFGHSIKTQDFFSNMGFTLKYGIRKTIR